MVNARRCSGDYHELSKTANYTSVSGDFSGATTPPTEIVYTISSSTKVTHTLPASAPALVGSNMACEIIENSLASYPYESQINTNSLTLDGTAYGANLVGVDPGKGIEDMFKRMNYIVTKGSLAYFSVSYWQGGILLAVFRSKRKRYFYPKGPPTTSHGVCSSVFRH